MTRLVDSPHTLQAWRRELERVFRLLVAGSLRDDTGRAARHVYLFRGGPYDGEHRVGAVAGPPVLRLPGPVAGGLIRGAVDPGAYTDTDPVWEYTRAMWTSGTTRGRAFSVTAYDL